MSSGWIVLDKSGGAPLVKRKVDSIADVVPEHLSSIHKGLDADLPDNVRNEYKKRKLIQEMVIKSFLLKKGKEFMTTITKLETDLTTAMLMSGSWKDQKFKEYNFNALGMIFIQT